MVKFRTYGYAHIAQDGNRSICNNKIDIIKIEVNE